MKVEYEVLLANSIWILVDYLKHQYVFTSKQAIKCKRDINRNIKKYKTQWVRKSFQQQKGINYFQTFVFIVKTTTNKVFFAVIAKN